ncbi:organic cation/carnitine transporter 7 [Beta vulgaris subsp. vulgaris]|uniref:organic cation/carnitine transporter 7 n=1 Tax=Beta vulgaris subsp. vulgaris TaxID=3555 RepID=UPI0020370574|nr:organic cation/carnitine transporter 7 [Beta vulgaris subsp. vulgaris]
MADRTAIYSMDDALLSVGFGKYQTLILIYAGLGWISEAMEVMILSFVGPAVQTEWNLTSEQESLITTVVFAGMLFGAYTWGLVSDRYGRRKGFLATALITSISGLLSAIAPNYVILLICRCLVGVGVGGGPVLLSWFLEFVPAPRRGTWMIIFQGFWTVGTVLEAGIAWIVMPRWGWRWLLGLSAMPAMLLLIFYCVVPESPRYLSLKGEKQGAMRILERISKVNDRELPPGVLCTDIEIEQYSDLPPQRKPLLPSVVDAEAASLPKGSDSETGILQSLSMLLSPKLIRSTLLLWVVFFGNAFAYYGLVLLTTELNKTDSTCYLRQIGSEDTATVNYRNVFITSFAEIPGLVLAAVIVDRLGRKVSMSALLFLCFLFMLPLVVHQSAGLTTAVLFGARACIMGSFTLMFLYAPEIYPTVVRSTGVGLGSSMARIGGMISPMVAISLVHGCHQTLAILLFVGVVLVSAICVMLFPIETMGRELTDSFFDSSTYERLVS